MRRRSRYCLPLTAGIITSCAPQANAHVKWFSPYDISESPQQIAHAFNYDFEVLFAVSVFMLLLGCAIESLAPGRALLRGIDVLTGSLETNADTLVRGGCGFFLVALWTLGGVILTPELKTGLPWVPWLQLAMAACLLWRKTLIFSAFGLIALYAIAVHFYGLFHLLDYPIFIGLALYLMMSGTQKSLYTIRALDVLRVSVAITLMWASVEKWAYPQWSYPIIESNPKLTMGFSREYYMQAAGLVEFALSFAILLGPLVRRTAAAMLLGVFVSAIGPFGKIDAIGHAPIIAVLAVILGDSAPGRSFLSFEIKSVWTYLRSLFLMTSCFGAVLASFIAAYYSLHTEFYPQNAISWCMCPVHAPTAVGQSPPASNELQSREIPVFKRWRSTSISSPQFLSLKPGAIAAGLAEHLRLPRTPAVCEAGTSGELEPTLD